MEGAAAADRVLEILDTPRAGPPEAAPDGPRSRGAGGDLRSEEIRLNAVTVAYPGGRQPALDGLSLVIRPGERIVVTGPSGAGKSTLLALLLRFVQPAAGTIVVGDTGLTGLELRAWRAQIAWVPQRPHLFAGSVARNIALGQPGASRAAIHRAAGLAGAAEFIEAWPAGYDTVLGEQALQLSSGQRQKIALARAFLRNAPLLLLDEPAAHLDPVSAHQIAGSIAALPDDRTVVLVTHGQSWLGGAGRAIRIDHGQLRPAALAPEPEASAAAAVPR
jgi:ATP-binding cassette subfamily C protein CydD